MRIATLLFLLCATASEAQADWSLAAFTGASRTPSNTLTLVGPDGVPNRIGPVDYVGEAWRAPMYYGYRIGWARAERGLGVEVEFTHAKAIATTHSTLLTDFQQSHGLNFVLANIVWRHPVAAGRLVLAARGGAGFTIPHVEGTYRGTHTESYQYGGLAWHAGAGV